MIIRSHPTTVTTLLDRRLSPYQLGVLAVCFALAFVDGMDSLAPSITGPLLASDLHLTSGALGAILSTSFFGALVGALVFSPMADQWGRRPVLIGCVLLFGLATLTTAWANSLNIVLLCRLVTGLGIGGTLPCILTISSEFAPRPTRAGVAAVIASALPLAGILIGAFGVLIIGHIGWRGLYVACGLASLLVWLLVAFLLPESIEYLVGKRKNPEQIRRILGRVAPDSETTGSDYFSAEAPRTELPVKTLFTDQRGGMTALLWVCVFLSSVELLGTLIWTPVLLKQAGVSPQGASGAFALNNVGGLIGGVLAGLAINRLRLRVFPLLAVVAVVGAVATASIGLVAPSIAGVVSISFAAGLFVAAVTSGLGVVTVVLYPAFMRATGTGWASGFLRLGSAIGPAAVGVLAARGLRPAADFMLLGSIGLLDMLCILVLGFVVRRTIRDDLGVAIFRSVDARESESVLDSAVLPTSK